jgi:hypothetical protein
VELRNDCATIGRSSELNDVALQPDPQRLVTRVAHCTVQRLGGEWWVTDNGSTNGTLVSQVGRWVRVQARVALASGDVIRILAARPSEDEAEYWEITFHDPAKTERVAPDLSLPYLEYDMDQVKLLRIHGPHRMEITGLGTHDHRLLRHMLNRNFSRGNVPVLCTYQELVDAIWQDHEGNPGPEDVNHLVYALRKKIDPKGNGSRYLENMRGQGYRLVTNPG